MKKILFLVLSVSLFSCKEKDLTVDNPNLPPENVSLSSSFTYGEAQLRTDSLYENNFGQRFYIDEVKFLVSDFYLQQQDDTVKEVNDKYFTYSLGTQSFLIAKITKGGYSGKYGVTLGLDSLAAATAKPEETSPDSGLRDQDMVRNDGFGYNTFVIKGRLLNPATPLDSIGTPFQYDLGTYLLSKELRSDQINFSVTNTTNARFFVIINVESVLEDFDIKKRPFITSDPSSPTDFTFASNMLNSLRIFLF